MIYEETQYNYTSTMNLCLLGGPIATELLWVLSLDSLVQVKLDKATTCIMTV